jgi:hypothetical protein
VRMIAVKRGMKRGLEEEIRRRRWREGFLE